MVIDLTMDSDSDNQPQRNSSQSESRKRKPDRDSETSSEAPFKQQKASGFRYTRTPSSGSSCAHSVSVVIPTRNIDQKPDIERINNANHEPIGVSEKHFPTDSYERRAMMGAYPKLRKVDRSTAVLKIATLTPAPSKTTYAVTKQLVERLRSKLAAIKGPKVAVSPSDELALARATQNFQFVNEYQLREGVNMVEESYNSGCSCGKMCTPYSCLCVVDNTKVVPYQPASDGSKVIVLTPQLLDKTSMIFECNPRCDCKGGCWNTVVQKSRTVRLEIFRTHNRGFGLRSPDYIRAGQFIDRYFGEIITQKVADKREEVAQGHSYLFTLDWGEDDDPDYSPPGDEKGPAGPYVVDGQKYGSPTRFINHSCSPNTKIVPSTPDHASTKVYDLAFFATKDIPQLTELTVDYNPDWRGSKKTDPDAVRCLCGEPNCRKQLWPTTRKGTK